VRRRVARGPLDAVGLMDAAVGMGLRGVEFPLPKELLHPGHTDRLAEALRQRGLRVVTDFLVIDEGDCEDLKWFVRSSWKLGAKVVRAIPSGVLCGDRRKLLPRGWEDRLAAVAARLREVLSLAADLGMCIALENHQDATTDDFLRLADMLDGHPAYGVCLDTGNPLAVGEEPVEAARRLAPLVRHVHLKDYTIHFAPEGYRLVRCAAGEGVIDFPAILKIIRANGHDVLPGIEVAWQATRTIPVLDPAWWACYPARQAAELATALRVLWAKGRPMDEPYGSAWERGGDSQAVSAEEWDVVRRSVAYFRKALP
jgi:sugar phosphate isomerase/epimerase